ncbi:MAG: hypothetical protein IAF02_01170 [Anaerolineae bacterium]|nr:hypothetical protein [Anaerolineae bacterium]
MSDDFSQLKDEEKEKLIEIEKADLDDLPASSTSSQPSHSYSNNKNWVAGVMLIAIGLIFLAMNLGKFYLESWWALFILIPAFVNFGNAVTDVRENGRLTKKGTGSITGGLILSLISCTFLFGWDWGVIWPAFLIIGGIGALLGGWFE